MQPWTAPGFPRSRSDHENTAMRPPPVPASATPSDGFWQEIRDFMREFILAAFDPYRPEQHYMRGPGPASHARRDAAAPEQPAELPTRH